MKDNCLKVIKIFVERYRVDHRPIILAISGGSDSMALLELMQAAKQFFPLDLHVAHVDHGFREESADEAKQLEELIDLPFYMTRLDPKQRVGNLEDWARDQRYQFFAKVAAKIDAQAVMVAHHLGDQAETVLKRVLEGAQLAKLGGIAPETIINGIKVWRPLLSLQKKELEAWLKSRFFNDSMNQDPKYLRVRMRETILPRLEAQFGKNIDRSLGRLAARGHDLSQYLDRQVAPYFAALEGRKIDFGPFYPLEKVEVIHFLSKLANSLGQTLTHTQLETLFNLLANRLPKKQIQSGDLLFQCHLGYLSVDKVKSMC
ncbi:MAG: tRNA lysidine(34) synthetase TilS [Chlamydiales bacterium]|nr:tRNA lysidine(34) synthetase TilS [Chlamydiales bacterium]